MVNWKKIIVMVVLSFFIIGGNDVWAKGDAPSQKVFVSREDVLDVAKEIHPPGCTDSMTADYCTLKTAYDTRAEIADLLGQGMSKQETLDFLIDKYGERILASPTGKGLNLIAWVLPGLSIAIGAILIAIFIRSWLVRKKGSDQRNEEMVESVSQADVKKVEEELRHWI